MNHVLHGKLEEIPLKFQTNLFGLMAIELKLNANEFIMIKFMNCWAKVCDSVWPYEWKARKTVNCKEKVFSRFTRLDDSEKVFPSIESRSIGVYAGTRKASSTLSEASNEAYVVEHSECTNVKSQCGVSEARWIVPVWIESCYEY